MTLPKFSQIDLENMALLSQLQTNLDQAVKEKNLTQECAVLGDLIRYHTVSGETQSARILHKELIPKHLQAVNAKMMSLCIEPRIVKFKSQASQMVKHELTHLARAY